MVFRNVILFLGALAMAASVVATNESEVPVSF